MIRRTASLAFSQSEQRIKVGILGSGISGCAVASTLLDSPDGKFDITLYEAGYGVGGRMSTRRILDDDGKALYQFDHGCQTIDPPKTKEFRSEFDRWKERGWVQPWKGNFATVAYKYTTEKNNNDGDDDDEGQQSRPQPRLRCDVGEEEKYVASPQMNSVCENLLQPKTSNDSTLEVVTSTHASAKEAIDTASDSDKKWQLEIKAKNKEEDDIKLGDYDWLIVTDRTSAQPHRLDLRDANVIDFTSTANKRIMSHKYIATMVAFDKPLPLDVDGVYFDYYSDKELMGQSFGTLGWIARDSSKPGRKSGDESEGEAAAECWVLHANKRKAKHLLDSLKDAPLGKIRAEIKDAMVDDFVKSLPLIASLTKNGGNAGDEVREVDVPTIVHATGHRWGAAFPYYPEKDGKVCTYKRMNCHVDLEKQFIACGDYFGEHHGSVEGAFLSGRAAANHLIDQVTSTEQ